MQQNDVRQMMTNPEALRAMMQIQQGMSQLQNSAPGLLRFVLECVCGMCCVWCVCVCVYVYLVCVCVFGVCLVCVCVCVCV